MLLALLQALQLLGGGAHFIGHGRFAAGAVQGAQQLPLALPLLHACCAVCIQLLAQRLCLWGRQAVIDQGMQLLVGDGRGSRDTGGGGGGGGGSHGGLVI